MGSLCVSSGAGVLLQLVGLAGDAVEFCRASSLLFGGASRSPNLPGYKRKGK